MRTTSAAPDAIPTKDSESKMLPMLSSPVLSDSESITSEFSFTSSVNFITDVDKSSNQQKPVPKPRKDSLASSLSSTSTNGARASVHGIADDKERSPSPTTLASSNSPYTLQHESESSSNPKLDVYISDSPPIERAPTRHGSLPRVLHRYIDKRASVNIDSNEVVINERSDPQNDLKIIAEEKEMEIAIPDKIVDNEDVMFVVETSDDDYIKKSNDPELIQSASTRKTTLDIKSDNSGYPSPKHDLNAVKNIAINPAITSRIPTDSSYSLSPTSTSPLILSNSIDSNSDIQQASLYTPPASPIRSGLSSFVHYI